MIEFQELNWVEFNGCVRALPVLSMLFKIYFTYAVIGFDPIKYILSLNLLSHGLKHFDWF